MECLFCGIGNNDIKSYTLYENDYVKCILDINPVTTAHTLIIPKKHYLDNEDITKEYLGYINDASKVIVNLVKNQYDVKGYRLVQNNGSMQEVKHYHMHILFDMNKEYNDNVEKVYNKLCKDGDL